MKTWKYINVQGWRTAINHELGEVNELVVNEQVFETSEAMKIKDDAEAKGLKVSMVGQIDGEEGERMFIPTVQEA